MDTTQPTIPLNNGVALPALGFGVFQTPPEVTQAAMEEALRAGYRMISTDELAAIDALDIGVRGGPDQDAIDFRSFKRDIPDG